MKGFPKKKHAQTFHEIFVQYYDYTREQKFDIISYKVKGDTETEKKKFSNFKSFSWQDLDNMV